MKIYEELQNEINQIERDRFHKRFVHEIITRLSFGTILVDIDHATYDEKEEIRNLLIERGISKQLLITDKDLNVAAKFVMSRAASLR